MSESVEPKQTEVVEISVEVKNIIEALIFASDEPVNARFIRSIFDEAGKELPPDEQLTVNADVVKKAVAELNRGYAKAGSSFKILEIAGGYVHATQEQFSAWVGKLAKEKARRRLSVTAVETLAIIAYKQPITKVEVEFIRGVNVDYIMKTLLEKDLIYISGRANTPGRPLLYGTTQKFLEHFGLNDITDLPKPREIEELIGETEAEVDRRLLAEQQQLEFKEELEERLEGHEGVKQKPKEQKQPRVKIKAPLEPAENPTKTEQPANPEQPESQEAVQSEVPSVEPIADGPSVETAQGTETEINDAPVPTQEAAGEENVEPIGEIQESKPSIIFSERGVESLDIQTNIESEEPAVASTPDETTIERETAEENHPIVQSVMPAETPEHDRQQDEPGQPASGWTKWKTKVKSFFQKIFG
ncbi:MAG: SMC-Scp complex subunit ScpB [Bacteroidota bacterium]